ncbi:MAG: type I-U CRISPR-associated protein Cas5/Cas6 [Deltaproteobacteria bacterium]|nr:MAG: type I-U CRISPR-associated protein Cas5/Cas6 [Deltaproteobacteria bacterium]
MLAIRMELLGGRWAASAYNDRTRVEWPPHPARLYSALVATWAETEGDDAEAAMLDALATLPPPRLHAPEIREQRQSGAVYVPVNDTSAIRTYDANWQKLNDAWLAREEALAALSADPGEKERRRLEKTVAKSERAIEKLRETVAGFLAQGEAPPKVLGLLPDRRAKQPRFFPSVCPDRPRIDFIWADAGPTMEEHRGALDALLARVHRVGHSHTLVTLRYTDDPMPANWEPHDEGGTILRWVEPGQRRALEEGHALHLGVEPRVMPARPVAYARCEEVREAREAPVSALAGDFIVYERCGGASLPLPQACRAARIAHRALVRFASRGHSDVVHRAVSGRDADGTPTQSPHVAIVPLPFVGSSYADGTVMGFAFLLPRDLDEEGRLAILRALGAWESHWRDEKRAAARMSPGDRGLADALDALDDERRIDLHGEHHTVELRRVRGRAQSYNLRDTTWTRAAREWMTVTPIALDRNPKTLWSGNPDAAARGGERAVASIGDACDRLGLPRPEHVALDRNPPLVGGEPVGRFPPFPEGERGPRRVLVHARIRFSQPVRGPLVLGAGRFVGLGLLRPIPRSALPRPEEDTE